MTRILVFLFLLAVNYFSTAQNSYQLLRKYAIEKEHFIGFDTQGNQFTVDNNELFKTNTNTEKTYTNYSFGKMHTVDISNPLKIVVCYKDFNNIVILDKQLNEREVLQIDYDIDFASNGSSDNLWLITSNFQHIQNFNFKTKKVISSSPPITIKNIEKVKSTANTIYLQNKDGIFTYDYLGNLLHSLYISDVDDFKYFKNTLFIAIQNKIYKVGADKKIKHILTHSNIINFEVINGDFYIFDGEELSQYSSVTNK
jgi:hypothetical protein